MSYSFHEDAEKEFNTAIQYYEECQVGLGLRFSHEILDAIKRICEYPDAWSLIDSKTRRCLTNRFPFGVLYRVVDNQIRIMAIMHLHRKPDYWMGR
jgi:plasmid stabilization system protein ParE